MNTPTPQRPTRLTVSGGPKVEPRLMLDPEHVRTVRHMAHPSEPTPLVRTRLFLLMGILIVVGIAVGVAYVLAQVVS